MRILLITSEPISEKSSSWLLLKDMIDNIHDHEIIIFTSSRYNLYKLYNYDIINSPTFLESTLLKVIINKTWKRINYYRNLYQANILSKRIAKIIERKSVDKVWVYSTMLTVLTLDKLMKIKPIPYHLSVFDDIFNDKSYKVYGNKLTDIYSNLLKNSSSLDVVVPEQREFYINNGLISSLHKVSISYGGYFKNSTSQKFQLNKNVKKICLTGNVFGITSFMFFCSSVKNICRKQEIEIHIYTNTNRFTLYTLKNKFSKFSDFVKIKPFIPKCQIIKTITKYDLSYIQVSFNHDDKHKAMTSFPSKTHDYLSATVPILLHSPEYSAISKFMKNKNICHIINSNNEKSISEAFEDSIKYDTRINIHENILKFNNNIVNEQSISIFSK